MRERKTEQIHSLHATVPISQLDLLFRCDTCVSLDDIWHSSLFHRGEACQMLSNEFLTQSGKSGQNIWIFGVLSPCETFF